MAASPEELRRLYEPLAKHVRTLLNNDLKNICRTEGLPVTGVKAALQSRVLNRLDEAVTSGDAVRFQELASKIKPQPLSSHTSASHTYSPSLTHAHHSPTTPRGHKSVSASSYSTSQPSMAFTDSPFYRIIGHPLTNVIHLPPMSSNRNTIRTSLTVSADQAAIMRENKQMKIMLYCASNDSPPVSGKVDIAFPNQIEIKVNGQIFQGNLRGIKKKAGTTRPADLTALVRKMAHYANDVEVTYAATEKRFSFLVQIVREYSVEELVDRIKRGSVISVQSVMNDMLNKAADPDIVTTSTIMSLKCPLSFSRMEIPCRSTICSHNQCFDASSFLQIQQQAPQWTCPICNKIFKFENIAVDGYVQNILQKTALSTEQILIEPNGVWRSSSQAAKATNERTAVKRKAEVVEPDDDLFEVSSPHSANFNNHINPSQLEKSPVTRKESHASGLVSKRLKHSTDEVIDLTFSSDEDLEPARPIKRQSLANQSLYNGNLDSLYSASPAASQLLPRTVSRVSFGMPSAHLPRRAEEHRGYEDWKG